MNWFTIALIVFAVIVVGHLVRDLVRPRRSGPDPHAKRRERDHGRGVEVDNSGFGRGMGDGPGF